MKILVTVATVIIIYYYSSQLVYGSHSWLIAICPLQIHAYALIIQNFNTSRKFHRPKPQPTSYLRPSTPSCENLPLFQTVSQLSVLSESCRCQIPTPGQSHPWERARRPHLLSLLSLTTGIRGLPAPPLLFSHLPIFPPRHRCLLFFTLLFAVCCRCLL